MNHTATHKKAKVDEHIYVGAIPDDAQTRDWLQYWSCTGREQLIDSYLHSEAKLPPGSLEALLKTEVNPSDHTRWNVYIYDDNLAHDPEGWLLYDQSPYPTLAAAKAAQTQFLSTPASKGCGSLINVDGKYVYAVARHDYFDDDRDKFLRSCFVCNVVPWHLTSNALFHAYFSVRHANIFAYLPEGSESEIRYNPDKSYGQSVSYD